jgi:hypothetical protein
MTEDLERRLHDGLTHLDLPAAPETLHVAARQLVSGPMPGPRRRLIPATVAVIVVVVAATALVVGGSSLLRVGVTASPATSPALASPQPSSTPTSSASPPESLAPSGVMTASDNGLSLTVSPADPDVTPGGTLTVSATIHNGRSDPVVLQIQRCGAPALMSFMLPFPADPSGRSWSGLAGDYKAFALGQLESSGGLLQPWYADAKPCPQDSGWVATLKPGETTTARLVWTAELVAGVPALPGDLDFTVTVGHDPTCTPPPGRECGPLGSIGGSVMSWPWTFQDLTASGGVLRIAGDSPTVVTAGQAIDALLADRRFSAWLSEEPAKTWSTASVMLLNYGPAQGIVPAGPSWEVDLFREKGVPRNWAIGFIDPFTAKVRNLTFCNAACSR